MADDKHEPQSYGSQSEWVTGEVGGTVNRQKDNPTSQQSDFYAPRRESEANAPHQGGDVSEEQIEENREKSGQALEEGEPVQKVTDLPGGAKRDSYFKKRDYE